MGYTPRSERRHEACTLHGDDLTQTCSCGIAICGRCPATADGQCPDCKPITSIAPLQVIAARHAIIIRVCTERGWDPADLTIDQLLAIRSLDEWKEANVLRSSPSPVDGVDDTPETSP